jgi:hypothetical protein
MRFRKLRIAWSVACGIACVLLIVLWVRSYWWVEIYCGQISAKRFLGIGILPGAIGGSIDDVGISRRDTLPTDKWLESTERILSQVAINQKRIKQSNPQKLKQLRPPPPLPSRIWGVFLFRTGQVFVPFWFLSLLTATSATLPWVKWAKRFSLRALLIATTLVAVVLGLAFYATRH